MKPEIKQSKKEILEAKEKLVLENFHRVSKQLGMITENVEEGWFDKSPEKIKAIGIEAIKMHPVKRKVYQDLLSKDPIKAEKYVMFLGKNPNTTQISWDTKLNDFIESSKSGFGLASGA